MLDSCLIQKYAMAREGFYEKQWQSKGDTMRTENTVTGGVFASAGV